MDHHRDVLQIEDVDEPLEDPGVGFEAVVVARLIGRQPATWEVERQAAELLAQAHDHVAEHEGPLSGAHQQ